MKGIAGLFLSLLLWASSVSAQPIYRHPQKAAYAPGDVLPWHEPQFHWLQPSGLIAHTHLKCTYHMYRVTTVAPFDLACTLTLYQTDGQITNLSGQSFSNFRFQDPTITVDDYGNLSRPLVGDPKADSVLTWNFSVMLDPLRRGFEDGGEYPPLHGKYTAYLREITRYTNGARVDGLWFATFYSLIDPSAPERHNDGTGVGDDMPVGGLAFPVYDPATDAIRVGGPLQGTPSWSGFNIVEIHARLPLAPIGQPWTLVKTKGYNYVADAVVPEGRYEIVLNPDFHHHNDGTALRFESTPKFEFDDTIDPAILPQRDNRVLIGWQRGTGPVDVPLHFPANEEVVTWVAFGVTKDDGAIVTPPPVVEPPPPPPVPTVFMPIFKHLGASKFICESDASCVELVTR